MKAVNASDLSLELRLATNRVRTQLLALADAGLLVAGSPGDRKHWYVRQDSPVWDLCVTLYEDWSR